MYSGDRERITCFSVFVNSKYCSLFVHLFSLILIDVDVCDYYNTVIVSALLSIQHVTVTLTFRLVPNGEVLT